MSEPFLSTSAYLPYSAAAVAGASQSTQTSPPVKEIQEIQIESEPVVETESGPLTVADWQAEESDLLPSFGVERARELLMWLINLELRLPPYTEVSPA